MPFSKLWKLSRPRFWIYVFGPFLVGLAAGARAPQDFLSLPILLFGFYFTLPANLLIYGVNDIFDYETDILNSKKTDYETLVTPQERPFLWRAIAMTNLPFIALLPLVPRASLMAMMAFLFFSLLYSAPPIRAKARPILDSMFNVLYIFPGVFAYFLIGGAAFSLPLFFAAWCWAMAMHAYSAVPDISSDRAAKLSTIATRFGFRGTLALCLLLYISSALLSFSVLGVLAAVLGVLYAGLMLLSLKSKTEGELLRVYKFFPLINTLSGMALFFAVAQSKLF
jgi:4-hydroxybenzoate polyprenyltransferase